METSRQIKPRPDRNTEALGCQDRVVRTTLLDEGRTHPRRVEKGRFGGMSGYSMEVFAEAHAARLLEEAETRRQLKAANRASEADWGGRAPRSRAIGRALAWLAKLVRPGRHAAAS